MRVACLLLLLSVALAACSGSSDEDAQSTLPDLEAVDELRAQFNEDRGEPRLLLLLSPT
jgi:hypothetical protein